MFQCPYVDSLQNLHYVDGEYLEKYWSPRLLVLQIHYLKEYNIVHRISQHLARLDVNHVSTIIMWTYRYVDMMVR